MKRKACGQGTLLIFPQRIIAPSVSTPRRHEGMRTGWRKTTPLLDMRQIKLGSHPHCSTSAMWTSGKSIFKRNGPATFGFSIRTGALGYGRLFEKLRWQIVRRVSGWNCPGVTGCSGAAGTGKSSLWRTAHPLPPEGWAAELCPFLRDNYSWSFSDDDCFF